MKNIVHALFATTALALSAQASAQVTFYEQEGFQGRTFTTQQRVRNLERAGFGHRASSVVVVGQRWQVCDDVRFEGRCSVLRPGQYPSLQAIALDNRISSVRPLSANQHVAEADYAPMPVVTRDFRRRHNESVYDVEVTSSRAVVGTPGQRCWTEQVQAAQPATAGDLNVPGAAIGAVIGGILGHQVGGGTGKQVATVAGVVGGAALGSQVGHGAAPVAVTHDVRRCDSNPVHATPAYWDVTYDFRGRQHHVQMATPPGRTIVVNRDGEPRV